jgi:hypothetical protein
VVKLQPVENMIDSRGVKAARPSDDPMDLVALRKQEFGKIAAVLAGYAGNQSSFH